jgi:hypothetical protein
MITQAKLLLAVRCPIQLLFEALPLARLLQSLQPCVFDFAARNFRNKRVHHMPVLLRFFKGSN